MVHHIPFGKSDCDARKAVVGSQSADTIKLNFIKHSVLSIARRYGAGAALAERIKNVPLPFCYPTPQCRAGQNVTR